MTLNTGTMTEKGRVESHDAEKEGSFYLRKSFTRLWKSKESERMMSKGLMLVLSVLLRRLDVRLRRKRNSGGI